MDGARFDALARTVADTIPRRSLLLGLASVLGLIGRQSGQAACPPGQIARRGHGCVCRRTGRPPVNGSCCNGGERDCGGTCIPQSGCCTADDCPPGPANTVQICRRGQCRSVCDTASEAAACGNRCCAPGENCLNPTTGECCTPPDPEEVCAAIPGVRSKRCGELAVQCLGPIDCGGCEAPETCGGAGQSTVCGIPINCVDCPPPQTCGAEFPDYCSGGVECPGDQIYGLAFAGPNVSPQPGCCLPPGVPIPDGCNAETVTSCCRFRTSSGGFEAGCSPTTNQCFIP